MNTVGTNSVEQSKDTLDKLENEQNTMNFTGANMDEPSGVSNIPGFITNPPSQIIADPNGDYSAFGFPEITGDGKKVETNPVKSSIKKLAEDAAEDYVLKKSITEELRDSNPVKRAMQEDDSSEENRGEEQTKKAVFSNVIEDEDFILGGKHTYPKMTKMPTDVPKASETLEIRQEDPTHVKVPSFLKETSIEFDDEETPDTITKSIAEQERKTPG